MNKTWACCFSSHCFYTLIVLFAWNMINSSELKNPAFHPFRFWQKSCSSRHWAELLLSVFGCLSSEESILPSYGLLFVFNRVIFTGHVRKFKTRVRFGFLILNLSIMYFKLYWAWTYVVCKYKLGSFHSKLRVFLVWLVLWFQRFLLWWCIWSIYFLFIN